MFNPNKIQQQETSAANDYIDNPELYRLILNLPNELASFHVNKIESGNMADEEAIIYIQNILNKRESATTVSNISDYEVRENLKGRESEIFNYIERDLFLDQDSQIGNGMTAKVKLYQIETESLVIPTAVKYLVTPTSKTLSAQGEHDMIIEVERMLAIEQLEEKDKDRLTHLKVPHPYFHHKTKDIQCYGMEYIDGVTLEQAAGGKWGKADIGEEVKNSLKKIDVEEILSEIDIFYDNMHEYCLHGDMKPGNMMIDRDGKFYIIDFGQSILVSHIPDTARGQLDVLRDDERKISKDAVKSLFNLYVK